MSYCTNCGQEITSGARFCSSCGMPVAGNNVNDERRSVYEGELHKCSNCGERIDAFMSNCPVCGYELRGSKNSNAVSEFARKLEQIEAQRISNSELYKKRRKLGTIHPIDEQKINLIRSFAIPNTKEDIYEFMILASSNIDTKLYGMEYHSSQFTGMLVASQKAVSDAWLAKFEQAYQKSRITLGGNSEFAFLENLYNQKKKELKWKKLQFPLFIIGGFLFPFVIIFLCNLIL